MNYKKCIPTVHHLNYLLQEIVASGFVQQRHTKCSSFALSERINTEQSYYNL